MKLEELKNYEIVEHRFLKDVNSDSYLLRHKKTGARVALMPNDDENKVFYIGFRTPPKDSTGVAHIVEHTVLCGSDKYPIKDPFVELCKGSLNTFLNAMTFPDKTVYPVASCNDFDFQNLMDVYLDAVFHPNIYKEEKIFRQEGWHYELEDEDDELTLNGVVYSEMKGAFSDPDDIIERKIYNSVFPDTPYGVESGGDPDVIPELTYEGFLNFHKKYYHPSNSYIFLYGNADMAEKLDYIDKEYLSKYEKEEVDSEIISQKPFEKQLDVSIEYPLTDDEDDKDKTYLNLTFVMGDYKEKELPIVLRAFEYAFSGNPAAPLRKALLDAGIGNEIYAASDCSLKQNMFGFYAKGCNVCDKNKFLSIIFNELERTYKEGFDKKTLLSFLTREEFKYREADFGRIPKGLAYGIDLLDSWLYDDDLAFFHIESLETYKFLKEAVNTDYFEKVLKECFLDNMHRVSVAGVPVKGLTNKKEKELSDKLASLKKSMSDEDIKRIVKETKELREYQESEDKPEDLEKIKLLKVSDIKKECKPSKNKLDKIADIPFLKQNIYTSGIAYLSLYFDISDLPLDHYRYLLPLSNLFVRLDTDNYKYGDLANDIQLYSGGLNMTTTNLRLINGHDIKTYYEINTKFLYENKEKVFSLLSEVLLHTKYEDKKKMREYLKELISQGESSLIGSSHNIAISRASSYYDAAYRLNDMLSGIEAIRFLKELENDFDNRFDEYVSELKYLVSFIFNKKRLLINLTSPDDKSNCLDDCLTSFIGLLSDDEINKEERTISPNVGNEGFIFPGQVQYVAQAGEYYSKGLLYKGTFSVLKTILGYDYLWNNVRVKGGAYGCFASFSVYGNCAIVSYRDPHLNNTLKIYKELADYLENFECTDRQMNQFIIGAISDIDVPQTPAAEGKLNVVYYLTGQEDNMRQKIRDEILNCTAKDIASLSEYIKCAFEEKHICVIGSEQKIKDNKDLFEKIDNLIK